MSAARRHVSEAVQNASGEIVIVRSWLSSAIRRLWREIIKHPTIQTPPRLMRNASGPAAWVFVWLSRNFMHEVTLNQTFAYPDPKSLPKAKLGGMTIAVTTRAAAAQHLIDSARANRGDKLPYFFTSANGQVLSMVASSPHVNALFKAADLVHADGQSIYLAARRLKFKPMPERVATTDLVHDVAKLAAAGNLSFFVLGARDDVNRRACENLTTTYPGLNIVGRHHGYFARDDEAEVVHMINAAKPDILWTLSSETARSCAM
eukprot:gene6523-6593_t